MKPIFFTVMTILIGLNMQAQDQKVNFIGGTFAYYDGPVQFPGEKTYRAWYKTGPSFNDAGTIYLEKEYFIIEWRSGEEWKAKITKTKKDFETDKTTYTGIWEDNDYECQLIIEDKGAYGCLTTVKSRRVFNREYKVKGWKKVYTFATGGACFIYYN